MSKKLTLKQLLLLCLTISLAIIVAGAFLFGFLGFNPDSSTADYTSIEVADNNGTIVTDSNYRAALEDFCFSEIDAAGYDVSDVEYSPAPTGTAGRLEFILRGSVNEDEIAAFTEQLSAALAEESYGESGTLAEVGDTSVTYHSGVYVPHYEYIWRTAIGIGVALVLLFAYVAIRFKVGMGVVTLLAAVHDVLLTLGAIALFRIPAGPTVICVAVFALLISIFFNLKVFGKMRQDLRLEERKELPAREAVALSAKESRKGIFIAGILAAAALVVLAVVGLIVGFDLFSFMLGSLIAVIAATYSSLIFAPALYAVIKERSDARRAERAKYNYASEKARKKSEKQEAKEANQEG